MQQEEQLNLQAIISQIEAIIVKLSKDDREPEDYVSYKIYESAARRRQVYQQALAVPYFGKLELQFADAEQPDIFLIGDKAIAKSAVEELVLDWRSAIGSVFYNFLGGSGDISYRSEAGYLYHVRVNRKRNIHIQDQLVLSVRETLSDEYQASEMQEQHDDNAPVNEFFQQFRSDLSQSYQLKKIIHTIQQEQNEAIRLGIDQPVLIQGVAGSGKTSIALHRLSYLLYRYRQQLQLENMIIIAPNQLFISYMKHILPDLELEMLQQTTFIDLALSWLPKLKSIQTPQQYLSQLVTQAKSSSSYKVQRFKGSLQFKALIEHYLQELEVGFFRVSSVKLPTIHSGQTLEVAPQLRKIYEGYKHLPLNKRREESIKSIHNWKTNELNKQYLQLQNELIAANTNMNGQSSRQLEDTIQDLGKQWDAILDKLTDAWKPLHALELYCDFMENRLAVSSAALGTQLVEQMIQEHQEHDIAKSVKYEDIAPLLLIQQKINGIIAHYDYMMIDEAQDLNAFQISFLMSHTKSLTLLGDTTQSIFGELGVLDWAEITSELFAEKGIRLDLTVSYRSTYEIMNAANHMLSSSGYPFPTINPLSRHGSKVEYRQVIDGNDLITRITEKLKQLLQQGMMKIAVISKSLALSKKLFGQFQQIHFPGMQLIEDASDALHENIIFISSELVKGLEFDAVIIPNANHRAFTSSLLDTKLLFVSMTRAQEELHIFYYEQPSPLLTHLLD